MRLLSRMFFRCLSLLLVFCVLLSVSTSFAHAQTLQDSARQLISPNTEADVPSNQHTFVQSLFLEIMLAVQCQLTGIDLTDPTKSCLGINLETGKLGYAPTDPNQENKYQIGGLLGVTAQGIGAMYTPTFGSQEYFRYIASNFGIIKPTYAQEAYTGFDGLSPVLELWKTTRDIAYYLLVIAFIFIGIGVMLRLKIDPRTVMTVQNQIPRVIICIILITFSYAFAGLLIDTMWAVTYMGINKITEAANPNIGCDNTNQTLSGYATRNILENPFRYANAIYTEECSNQWGIFGVGKNVANAITSVQINALIVSFLFGANEAASCGITSVDECPMHALVTATKWLVSFIWFFIVLVALLIALFKIWFELIKAYIMVFLYTILAPIWIVFGLLPKRPLGFEKWLRIYFANLAAFPAVVFMLVGARVLDELFTRSGYSMSMMFVPPLVGNPAEPASFGAILQFGMILMAPTVLGLIREKLGVTPNKQVGQAAQTFSAGRAAVGAPPRQIKKHLSRRDQQGNAIGPLARMSDSITGGLAKTFSWVPGVKGMHEISEAEKQEYGGARKARIARDEYGNDYKRARAEAKAAGKQEWKDFKNKYPDVLSWARVNRPNDTRISSSAGLPPHLAAELARNQSQTAGSGQGHNGQQPVSPTTPAPTGTGQPTATQPTGQQGEFVGHIDLTVRTSGGTGQGTTSIPLAGRGGTSIQQVIVDAAGGNAEVGRQFAANPKYAQIATEHLADEGATPAQASAIHEFLSEHAAGQQQSTGAGGEETSTGNGETTA